MAVSRLPARFPYRPAMEFHEIAHVLGTTTQAVWCTYVTAMRKIARRRQSLEQLAQVVSESQSRRQVGHVRCAGGAVWQ